MGFFFLERGERRFRVISVGVMKGGGRAPPPPSPPFAASKSPKLERSEPTGVGGTWRGRGGRGVCVPVLQHPRWESQLNPPGTIVTHPPTPPHPALFWGNFHRFWLWGDVSYSRQGKGHPGTPLRPGGPSSCGGTGGEVGGRGTWSELQLPTAGIYSRSAQIPVRCRWGLFPSFTQHPPPPPGGLGAASPSPRAAR